VKLRHYFIVSSAALLLIVGFIAVVVQPLRSNAIAASMSPLRQAQQTATPEPAQAAPPPTPIPDLSISDDYCLDCHGKPGPVMKLADGEELDLYIPPELHQNSVHGQLGYACVQCHRSIGEYPHPPFTATDRRDVTLQLVDTCKYCHAHQYELAQDSVHAAALAAGKRQAATCSDCHTAHEVRRLTDPATHTLLPDARIWIPQRCALCHNAIYMKYKDSVHGAALTEGNPDVPTCIDCHGVHNIQNPTTNAFRLKSPLLCARCHTDETLMTKYGLSTNVLNTYVADFHGTTTEVFAKESPDAQVNTPVCFDCHGVHDISRVDDPQSGLQMKQNLLARCHECHPDATAEFPSAWMSHYTPSPDVYPLVYYVNLFYKFLIPGTLGGMALLVAMDAGRTLIDRRRSKARGRRVVKGPPAEPKPEAGAEPVTAHTAPAKPPVQAAESSPPPSLADQATTPPSPDPKQPGPEVKHE
jgi:hypothetical protein